MKVKSKNFSIIDKDMRVEGTLDTSGKLIVRGTVIGELRADTLLIDKGGAVQAAARVADMTIGGRFDGEIEASGQLIVLSSGRCCGRVVCGDFVVEAGGVLDAEVTCTTPQKEEGKAS